MHSDHERRDDNRKLKGCGFCLQIPVSLLLMLAWLDQVHPFLLVR